MVPNDYPPREGDEYDESGESLGRRVGSPDRASDASASPDVLFELLAGERRRYVLYCLAECEAPVTVTELAAPIAARENDATVDEVSPAARRRTRTGLYHVDLPKLEDAGVIELDREGERIAPAERFSDVAAHLETVRKLEPDEHEALCEQLRAAGVGASGEAGERRAESQ